MFHFVPITRFFPEHNPTQDIKEELIQEIKIHRIGEIQGKYFVIAVDSGVFFEISREAEEQLRLFESSKNLKDLSEDIKKEILDLARIGAFEKKVEYHVNKPIVTSLNINICHNCNLSCDYCFADMGKYGGDTSVIDLATGQKAIDMLLKQLPEKAGATVVLFGGEPLLEKDIVFSLMDYGKEEATKQNKGINFDIFTNGTLVDDMVLSRFKGDQTFRILFSMDGTPDMNDEFRHGYEGVSLAIEDNLKKLLAIDPKRIVIRGTIAKSKPDLVKRAKYFVNLGAYNIVFEPAYCKTNEKISEILAIYKGIEEELTDLSDYLVNTIKAGKKINISLISASISEILQNQGNAGVAYVPACPAARTYISVDVKGDIYPCHYFNCNSDYLLGNITTGFSHKNMVSENREKDLSKEGNNRCDKCHYQSVCSGLCPFKSLVMYPTKEDEYVQDEFCRLVELKYMESLRILSNFYNKANYPYIGNWMKSIKQSNY